MLYYRLYFMHRSTGHIERFADFEAPDDGHALELANEHIGDHPLELWNESRKVRRIAARDAASPGDEAADPGAYPPSSRSVMGIDG